jgi:ABC-type proline/glycine betaine transport system ATPase subunit
MNPQSGNKSPADENNQKFPLTELYQKIDAGVKFAVADAIEKHRRLGQSICIWKDGKIVTLTPDQIPENPQVTKSSNNI